MAGLKSWLRASSTTTLPTSNAAQTSPSKAGLSDIEHAMESAELIMNDDIAGAEALFRTRQATSTFHQLGLGVCAFMTSILGFEKEAMTEAANRLAESENRAWADLKKAQKEAAGSSWFGSSTANVPDRIYPPASEYALVHAQSQLMSAVVGVMHESVTEALKGFYKLRKAFVTLDGIMEAERRYVDRVRGGGVDASRPTTAERVKMEEELMPGSFNQDEFLDTPNDSDEFVDAVSTPNSGSNVNIPALRPRIPSANDEELFKAPMDIFIHSATTMCYGVLLLIISMVPPAFSKLLSIIGFKGDRERGVSMLWAATRFRNVYGAITGMVLLFYYNGLMGFADILPSDRDAAELADDGEIVGYPRDRCMALLEEMRARYPDSRLWKLQAAKELGLVRRLDEANALLESNIGNYKANKPNQTVALATFELAMNHLCSMDWQPMRDGFLRCLELNKWSHSMYYYFAGCAELEMYRDAYHLSRSSSITEQEKSVAETEARKHKKLAEEHFRKAPTLAGKKRFMARQMPMESFVCRKVAKWEERRVALGGKVDLPDVIVVSPAMEMMYHWNGSKRMTDELLEKALGFLDMDRCTMPAEQRSKVLGLEKDEAGIKAVSEAALLRRLGRTDEARRTLENVLAMDKAAFKGGHKDDYIIPAATYEMAASAWWECCDEAKWPTDPSKVEGYRRERVEECANYLEKLVKWEAFLLDGRFGLRIQGGLDSVKWLKAKKGW
ncbi:Mitochondrial outer membrane protein iml2 [Coniochaeta pulveracea]|uniref:Inclusion body clearance protein IML2 n=1 Tax=Coniochaeta pulveracea TaxID=177199 RepID=A0A420YLL4_9PEZI|nr:Mitochondrial outer membrane protein iml2 [Coniochaeta pulveracea]